MVEITPIATKIDGPDGFMASISDLLLVQEADALKLYTISNAGGGIQQLLPERGLSLKDTAYLFETEGLDAAG